MPKFEEVANSVMAPGVIEGVDATSSFDVAGWGAKDSSGKLELMKFQRKEPCGICRTDLHFLRNKWKSSIYPMVPGHEIVGVVTKVGINVKKFKAGDHVGAGFTVDSCRKCGCCEGDAEQFCEKIVQTSNTKLPDGRNTMEGYCSCMVRDEKFCVKVPKNFPMDADAPLLCAGITVYSPMHHFGMNQNGKRFGVVGLGGLGHIAVKFGKAFGMKVTVISTSISKEKEARELLGAADFLVSKNDNQMKKYAETLDYIIDSVSATHPMEPLLNLLKFDGRLVIVGVPEHPLELPAGAVVFGQKMVAVTFIGSIKEVQQMMDLCGKNRGASAQMHQCNGSNRGDIKMNTCDFMLHKIEDQAYGAVQMMKTSGTISEKAMPKQINEDLDIVSNLKQVLIVVLWAIRKFTFRVSLLKIEGGRYHYPNQTVCNKPEDKLATSALNSNCSRERSASMSSIECLKMKNGCRSREATTNAMLQIMKGALLQASEAVGIFLILSFLTILAADSIKQISRGFDYQGIKKKADSY